MWTQLKLLPAATKLGQGNILTSVCLSTGGGCIPACLAGQSRGGCLQFFGGGLSGVRGNPPIFLGGDFFFDFCFLWGYIPTPPPPPPEAESSIWSTSGRYASYWNAFLWFLQSVNEFYQRNVLFAQKGLAGVGQLDHCEETEIDLGGTG